MVASFLAIKLSSRGPVLYRAERAGRDGHKFVMYKLRTMTVGSEAAGAITGGAADSRIFYAGRALRAVKLDELPQLFNIVRGDMAFVGPRPEAPRIVTDHYQPWMMETLKVPPGVVGPGSLGYFLEEEQIPAEPAAAEKYYVDVLLPRKLARDLVFVRDGSLRYRAQIIVRTLLGIVRLDHLAGRLRARESRAAESLLTSIHTRVEVVAPEVDI
jgi:lipopolysaccharide/colanic/teichoic acid biosynthesis glycosyltransferase